MLSRLARQVSSMGYTGFEYATGIPGTLGGGVTMNAVPMAERSATIYCGLN